MSTTRNGIGLGMCMLLCMCSYQCGSSTGRISESSRKPYDSWDLSREKRKGHEEGEEEANNEWKSALLRLSSRGEKPWSHQLQPGSLYLHITEIVWK